MVVDMDCLPYSGGHDSKTQDEQAYDYAATTECLLWPWRESVQNAGTQISRATCTESSYSPHPNHPTGTLTTG
jgi:hypothetical protein